MINNKRRVYGDTTPRHHTQISHPDITPRYHDDTTPRYHDEMNIVSQHAPYRTFWIYFRVSLISEVVVQRCSVKYVLLEISEVVVQRCSVKNVLLEISQNWQENTYIRSMLHYYRNCKWIDGFLWDCNILGWYGLKKKTDDSLHLLSLLPTPALKRVKIWCLKNH